VSAPSAAPLSDVSVTVVVQAPAIGESQRKWVDFWSSSMKAFQSNIETATAVGTKAIDGWVRFVRDHREAVEAPTLKAA